MKQKKICIYLLTLLILFSCILTSCSFEEESQLLIPDVKKDTYIYDQGKFIDDQVEEKINNLLIQLEEQTTIEFVVITIPSLNNLTIENYAVKLGNKLGIGKAETDNGILLLISKEDTKVRLEIGKGLQGILTDATSGRILDAFFVPSRDKDNYDEASLNTVQAVINCLAKIEEYNISINGIDKEIIPEPEKEYSTSEIISFIIIIIMILIILEWITGKIFGDGFGDGIVFIILNAVTDSDSGSSGFGGGSFNGGGASR